MVQVSRGYSQKPRIARVLTGITALTQNIRFSDIHLVDIGSNLSDGYLFEEVVTSVSEL